MIEINVDGVRYTVSEPTQDPSMREIRAGDELVGSIGLFGGQYRLHKVDGTATSSIAPRSLKGIEQLVRTLHGERSAR